MRQRCAVRRHQLIFMISYCDVLTNYWLVYKSRIYTVLEQLPDNADGPRDAITPSCLLRCNKAGRWVINSWRPSSTVDSTWPRPPSSPGVVITQTNDWLSVVRAYVHGECIASTAVYRRRCDQRLHRWRLYWPHLRTVRLRQHEGNSRCIKEVDFSG